MFFLRMMLLIVTLSSCSLFDRNDRSVLKVGTTGDYAPFSWDNKGNFEGLDIDLWERFARDKGIKIEWVKTSWPDLMRDWNNKRFSVAASGITITQARKKMAHFSLPYYQGGKKALLRCRDLDIFVDNASLDRVGVTAIVNPGGTNQKFAKSFFTKADLVFHHDNRSIFEELIAGRADVMITDSIEAKTKAQQYLELCSPFSKLPDSDFEVGVMFKDKELKEKFNDWMLRSKNQKYIRSLFEFYL